MAHNTHICPNNNKTYNANNNQTIQFCTKRPKYITYILHLLIRFFLNDQIFRKMRKSTNAKNKTENKKENTISKHQISPQFHTASKCSTNASALSICCCIYCSIHAQSGWPSDVTGR